MNIKRKQLIIDKKFQLKTTFSIIGIVAVIVALIIIVIGANIVVNNGKMGKNNVNIDSNNKNIKNINEIQDNIVHFLSSRTLKNEDKIYSQAIKDISKNHIANMEKMKSIMSSNEKIMESNRDIMKMNNWLLIAIIIVIIAGTVVLYFQLIRKTHRISGPIYVMTLYMKEVLKGNYPEFRELRTHDELKDFYDLFKEVVGHIKAKSKKK